MNVTCDRLTYSNYLIRKRSSKKKIDHVKHRILHNDKCSNQIEKLPRLVENTHYAVGFKKYSKTKPIQVNSVNQSNVNDSSNLIRNTKLKIDSTISILQSSDYSKGASFNDDEYEQTDNSRSKTRQSYRPSTTKQKSHFKNLLNNYQQLPARRIQMLPAVEKDPMFKFTGRFTDHTMGFKVLERSLSLNVLPDNELIEEVKKMERCERMQTKKMESEETSFENELGLFGSKNSLDECSVEDQLSCLDSLSGTSSDEMSTYICPIKKYPFHLYFNPVVQIFPNQKVWPSKKSNILLNNNNNNNNIKDKKLFVLPTNEMNISNQLNFETKRASLKTSILTLKEMKHQSDVTCSVESTDLSLSFDNNISLGQQNLSSAIYNSDDDDDYSFESETDDSNGKSRFRGRKMRGVSMAGRKSLFGKSSMFMRPMGVSMNQRLQTNRRLTTFPPKSMLGKFMAGKSREKDDYLDKSSGSDEQSDAKLLPTCLKVIKAANDPNPMLWFYLLNEQINVPTVSNLTTEHKLKATLHLKDLAKRFTSLTGGLSGLKIELEKDWEIRPKADLSAKYFIKNHVLDIPLTIEHADLLKRLYKNTIVRYPLLYKMLLKRREVLPIEIQQFLNRILELTDTSDKMITSLFIPLWKSVSLSNAAREMDASGFMMGGPKPKDYMLRKSISFETNEDLVTKDVHRDSDNSDRRKPTNFTQYGKEIDEDKAFYINLRSPCHSILEEVSLRFPEFAWHIRPLFELRWALLENQFGQRLVELELLKNEENDNRLPTFFKHFNSKDECSNNTRFCYANSMEKFDSNGQYNWFKTLDLVHFLFNRTLYNFNTIDIQSPGHTLWSDLLICLHISKYCSHLTDLIVYECDLWISSLLIGLESTYSSVREEVCCVLSYLVTSHLLMMKLHNANKNLFVASIILSLFVAIGAHPKSYEFYHGLMGYLLHSIPCTLIFDCLLMWIPPIIDLSTNLLARDWGLFVYYVLKYWPQKMLDTVDLVQKKKLLKLLEMGYLKSHSKQACRLALTSLLETCKDVRSPLLTCWFKLDEEKLAG